MEGGRYQLYRHKRTQSIQKSQPNPKDLKSQEPQPYRSNNYTSYLSRKISKNPPVEEIPPIESQQSPAVTCKAGCAYDIEKKRFMWKSNSSEKREIASLTKIMTCWVVIQYIRGNKIVPEEEYFVVSKKAAEIGGTSAELEEGDTISVWDLLHGLMLPSGNDAAMCLAEGIGRFLGDNKKPPLECFVAEMNHQAIKFNMANTSYINPHGLSHKNHKSTCEDQILLIRRVFQDSIFQALIEKKVYFCNIEEKTGWSRQMLWQSTNKLLHNGFNGIKTGSTPQAGPCLASWYKKDGLNILIVTLSSTNADSRFKDSIKIIKWIKQKSLDEE